MLVVTHVNDSWWPEVLLVCDTLEDSDAAIREHAASNSIDITSMVEGGETDPFVRHYRTGGGSVESRNSYIVEQVEQE